MNAENVFFKMKSSKRSNPETRTMLDALHSQKVTDFKTEQTNLDIVRKKISELDDKISKGTNDVELWHLERERDKLNRELTAIQNNDKMMDYFLRSGDILFSYYDAQDKIHSGEKPTQTTIKAKPGSILAILEQVSSAAETEVPAAGGAGASAGTAASCPQPQPQPPQAHIEKKEVQRNDLLNKYLIIESPEMAKHEMEIEDPWTYCEDCGAEMTMCLNEAILTCSECGFQEKILVDSDKPSYKDPPRENSYYAYKQINHFNELLAQFQAKENTEIPTDIYDNILVQLKKERITDMSTLTPKKLREILRKLKCSKYYEHIPHIMNRLNGQNAPHISHENEEKLRHMFREIKPSFIKHKQKGRRNFLSYSYVLYKFCELLEMDEFLKCFVLLKNRDKLYLQDQTWKLICKDMNWQYLRTI